MTPQDPDSKSPLPVEITRRLLELLSTDDAFRERFSANPTEALSSLGATPSEAAAGCDAVPTLASKADFAAAHEALLAHLTKVAAFLNPHCFINAAE